MTYSNAINAQNQTAKADYSPMKIQWLTPIEVIRNIDQILAKSRLEALEAGRGTAFAEKINVAKSFVHAGDNEEAKRSYSEAISIAWKRETNHDVLEAIEHELERSKKILVQDSRPSGLDENYQAISNYDTKRTAELNSIDEYEAGKKIDAALSFIYLSILTQQDQKLTLQGKLNHCRHLIELEEYESAKKEYHSTIIAYLDPRWTSQLLGEIDEIISAIEPSQTFSELHPNEVLTAERAIGEIQTIIKPIQDYYSGNAILNSGLRSIHSMIRKGEHDMALSEMKKTFSDFAPSSWLNASVIRTERILDRIGDFQENSYEGEKIPSAPILYSKSVDDGRTTETIRIIEDNELMTYKRVTHNWGGVYSFINNESAKDTEWIRVWKLYQEQEF